MNAVISPGLGVSANLKWQVEISRLSRPAFQATETPELCEACTINDLQEEKGSSFDVSMVESLT